jgi:hypothetical protein
MSANAPSRRGFLFRGATAAAAVAVPLAPALALAAAPKSAELPEILQIGADLDAAERAFDAAFEVKRQARALAEQLCPALPEELIVAPWDRYWTLDPTKRDETDIEGETVWPADPKMRPRQIVQASGLRIDVQDYGSRTKLGKLARRLLKLAEEYEQGRENARQQSGLIEAERASDQASSALMLIAYRADKAPAATLSGVTIKARAMLAQIRADGSPHVATMQHGRALAEAVAALAPTGLQL